MFINTWNQNPTHIHILWPFFTVCTFSSSNGWMGCRDKKKKICTSHWFHGNSTRDLILNSRWVEGKSQNMKSSWRLSLTMHGQNLPSHAADLYSVQWRSFFFFLFRVFVILQLPKQLNVHARNNRAQWKTIQLFLQN